MNNRTRFIMLIVAIAVLGLCTQAQPQVTVVWAENRDGIQDQGKLSYASFALREPVTAQDSTRYAANGDIATGSVVDTTGSGLRLNIRPCDAKPFVVIFHQPYSRSMRGQKNCGGQTVTIEQIQQN